MFPQGIYSNAFYELINNALMAKGYSKGLEDFISINPKYWFDEEGWKSIYKLSDFENPTRTFEQRIGDQYVPVMATYLSDDAETPLLTNEGFEKQTGDIPRMGQGMNFSTKSYEDARKFSRTVGELNDRVYKALVLDTQKLIKTVHAQRTFTGYQIESTGVYTSTKVNNNGGIENLKIDTHPVAANTKKCGGFWYGGHQKGTKNAWSSSSASPIGDLKDMFNYAIKNHILSADPNANVFRMSESAYNTLKDHADTKTKVAMWKSGLLIDNSNIQYYEVSDEDLRGYLASQSLPKVEKVSYYGFNKYVSDGKILTQEISAFDANTVILRYAGLFGEMQWCKVTNLFETSDAPIYYSEGGAIAVQQETSKKGVRYSAESLCAPIPYATQRVLRLKINEAAD